MSILALSDANRARLKIAAYFIVILGLTLGWSNHAGWFRNKAKMAFAELVMSREEEIPRNTPGFELFLQAFPPPSDIDPAQVSAIADRILRVNSTADVGITVAYIAAGRRSSTIATHSDVREWSRATPFQILSLILSTIGVAIALPLQLHDYRNSRKA
jgi:hypothetical protein